MALRPNPPRLPATPGRSRDGAIAATYDYTPFGTTTAHETYVQNRFRFASGEFVDAGTTGGLYYFRNRYYDPDLRRWISEDPLGLEGGPNWYAYVGNDPINLADPWGLKAQRPMYCYWQSYVTSDELNAGVYVCEWQPVGGGSWLDGLAGLMSLGRPVGLPRLTSVGGRAFRGAARVYRTAEYWVVRNAQCIGDIAGVAAAGAGDLLLGLTGFQAGIGIAAVRSSAGVVAGLARAGQWGAARQVISATNRQMVQGATAFTGAGTRRLHASLLMEIDRADIPTIMGWLQRAIQFQTLEALETAWSSCRAN